MEIIYVILFLIIVGGLMFWYLESCPHCWVIIEKGALKRRKTDTNDEWIKYGYYTIHECVHCKKLKKEEIEII